MQTHALVQNALGPLETAARCMQVTQALRGTKPFALGIALSARLA